MKQKFKNLIIYCRSKKIKVSFVDSRRLRDYAGMNSNIAKILGFEKIGKREILLDKGQLEETQYHNLVHEIVEMQLMDKGYPYWQAHLAALKAEKKPFRRK